MSSRRAFLKNIFGVAAGSVIAAKAGSELFKEDELEQQFDTPENIAKNAPTYPIGSPATSSIIAQTETFTLHPNNGSITQEDYNKRIQETEKQFQKMIFKTIDDAIRKNTT